MIKLVTDANELKFAKLLYIKMHKEIFTKDIGAAKEFDWLLTFPSTKVFGFYDQDILIGIIVGTEQTSKIFVITGLYFKYKWKLKYFISEVEKELKKLGYTRWVSEYHRQDNKNDIAAYIGATKVITYYKDL